VDRQVVRQDLLFLRDDPPRFGFGDMDPTGGVEDGGDPVVPVREGRFHDRSSRFMLTGIQMQGACQVAKEGLESVNRLIMFGLLILQGGRERSIE